MEACKPSTLASSHVANDEFLDFSLEVGVNVRLFHTLSSKPRAQVFSGVDSIVAHGLTESQPGLSSDSWPVHALTANVCFEWSSAEPLWEPLQNAICDYGVCSCPHQRTQES